MHAVRHEPGGEDDEHDPGDPEERRQVEPPAVDVDEHADPDGDREADDGAEELPLPGSREQQERRLHALPRHGEEGQQEEPPDRAAGRERLLHATLELRLEVARPLEHPEDHPGEECRGQQQRRALVDLLGRALELGVERVQHAEEREAHDRGGADARPHEPMRPPRADPREVGEHDPDDERHLDALAKCDDQR